GGVEGGRVRGARHTGERTRRIELDGRPQVHLTLDGPGRPDRVAAHRPGGQRPAARLPSCLSPGQRHGYVWLGQPSRAGRRLATAGALAPPPASPPGTGRPKPAPATP